MTAVEFLEQELDKNFEIRGNSFLFDKILKQAKEMEKEQREKDFIQGYKKRAEMSNSIFDETSEESAKVLFIETLKSEQDESSRKTN